MKQEPEAKQNENQEGAGGPKKPYTKPACVSEEIFETSALACGKTPGSGGACIGAPHRS